MYNWRIELLNIGKDYGFSISEINDIIDIVAIDCWYHTNIYNIQYGLEIMTKYYERKIENE